MAYRSSGNLEKDIKDIAIKQMGGNKAYNALDSDGKSKIDSYAEDLTGAIKSFLQMEVGSAKANGEDFTSSQRGLHAFSCIILFSFLIVLLNIFGLKKVEKTQLFIVSISIISLMVIVALGFSSFDTKLTEPVFIDGRDGFIAGVAFLYISYAGVTKIAAIAGEIKNPAKNLPLTMIISLFLITTIYCLVALVLVGNVEASILATDIKPIHTLFQTIGGDTFGLIAGVVGVLTLLSMVNSGVLASSRFPFAMSKDGLLPGYLAKVNSKFI